MTAQKPRTAAKVAADLDMVLARLRNLHQPTAWQSGAFGTLRLCRECLHQWPCSTAQITGHPQG